MSEKKTTRGMDPEIVAMYEIDRILSGLPADARVRVMDWLQGRENNRVDPVEVSP